MRAADRQRSKTRRTHQLGESDAQFEERIRIELERATGLRVEVKRMSIYDERPYIIAGYTERGYQLHEPLIRVRAREFTRAASAFENAAQQLRTWGKP